MTHLLAFILSIILYPKPALARYGSSSSGNFIMFLIFLGLILIYFLYVYISRIEEKRAERKYNIILHSEKTRIENDLHEHNLAIIRKLEKREQDIKKREEALAFNKQIQDKLFEEKTKGFPWVAEAYGRFWADKLDPFENYFLDKKNPSYKSAELVRELKYRIKESEKNSFIYKGIIDFYTTLFPWIKDFSDAPDDVISIEHNNEDIKYEERAKQYLTNSEWDSLPREQKFQIALDRYKQRHKSNWEIGREYERYIGYLYEKDGWDVEFYGAIKKLEDMGRDLICKNGNKIQIVKCKYWTQEKIIHEKHNFQLYGNCVQYSIENKKEPIGVFITSCSLSEMAKKCANHLGIEVKEYIKLEDFPCIKCNIGKDGNKIYHLPFDQMYDKVKIKTKRGECYCYTISEAESLGFRRAFRWYG